MLKRKIFLLGSFLLVFTILGSVFVKNDMAYAKKCQSLQVKGTKIVTAKGKEITLRGVSTHGIAWFPQYVNKEAFRSFQKMGANTIRLALYSDPAAGFQKTLYGKVEEGIKAATDLGMYVIVDWHILSDGNPKTNQSAAKEFFTHFAKKYASQKNIIYEICNEPNGNVTWEKDIKPYAQNMISLIRKYDKNALIIVGTPTWSQDVDVVANNPIKGEKNILYALHFYAATHGDWIRKKLEVAHKKQLPVFVSEFSICDASGNGAINTKEAKKWMKLLKKYKIARIAWSLCNKNETSALLKPSCKKTTKISKSDLSKTGKWIVKNW